MTVYPIKKNVPIPSADWKELQYPLTEMEVGDCFTVRFSTDVEEFDNQPISSFEELNPNFKFLKRKIGLGQYRIWRVPANKAQEKEYTSKLNGTGEKTTKTPTFKKSIKSKGKTGNKRAPYLTKRRMAELEAKRLEEIQEKTVTASDTVVGQM